MQHGLQTIPIVAAMRKEKGTTQALADWLTVMVAGCLLVGVALAGCTTYFVAEVMFTTVTFCRAAVEDALYVQLAPAAQAAGPVPEKAARCCMATICTATCIAEQC